MMKDECELQKLSRGTEIVWYRWDERLENI